MSLMIVSTKISPLSLLHEATVPSLFPYTCVIQGLVSFHLQERIKVTPSATVSHRQTFTCYSTL